MHRAYRLSILRPGRPDLHRAAVGQQRIHGPGRPAHPPAPPPGGTTTTPHREYSQQQPRTDPYTRCFTAAALLSYDENAAPCRRNPGPSGTTRRSLTVAGPPSGPRDREPAARRARAVPASRPAGTAVTLDDSRIANPTWVLYGRDWPCRQGPERRGYPHPGARPGAGCCKGISPRHYAGALSCDRCDALTATAPFGHPVAAPDRAAAGRLRPGRAAARQLHRRQLEPRHCGQCRARPSPAAAGTNTKVPEPGAGNIELTPGPQPGQSLGQIDADARRSRSRPARSPPGWSRRRTAARSGARPRRLTANASRSTSPTDPACHQAAPERPVKRRHPHQARQTAVRQPSGCRPHRNGAVLSAEHCAQNIPFGCG